ncbi:GDSL esterase/lipase At3g53100-like [Rutidosis leptorrhynchoides]|uniref:GDSL esterase/lipase At3g53100-like n=1 Tax=Rutidosis leptorrhynchoides TaxID=125765 RepID=UPI003A99D47E
MEYSTCRLLILSCIAVSINMIHSNPLVPALCIFGDSSMDVGNNNHFMTLLKANFLPYGRDFITHKPTGRFCNGKLAVDYAAEYLGFKTYPLPYLSATNETLLTGANFASAGTGFYDKTTLLFQAITLPRQVSYYEDWRNRVARKVGKERAYAMISGGIHILSAGSSDFLQNYYINPLLNTIYTPSQFSDILLTSYNTFVQKLYQLGVRKIGVTTLPPMGCLPGAITLFGFGTNKCMSRLNDDAMMFNKSLNETSQKLVARYRDLKIVVFDIYQPLLDIITKPSDHGFSESRRGCCGTGIVEISFLCNAISIGTCSNATSFVFWDGFHPSEATNQMLTRKLLMQGLSLIS